MRQKREVQAENRHILGLKARQDLVIANLRAATTEDEVHLVLLVAQEDAAPQQKVAPKEDDKP